MKCDILRIAIVHPVSAPWVARMLDGINQYANEQGGWHLFFIPPAAYGAEKSTPSLRALKGWKGDGILAATNEPDELRYAKRSGIPTVNLASGLQRQYGITRVTVDNYAAGRMAAEHLLERGLTHLAFYGWDQLWYSLQRYDGFKNRVEETGAKCNALLRPWNNTRELNWAQRLSVPAKWLASLKLPCGIFAAQDFKAQLLLDACSEIGLRVPDDIAIVGMDNNETICEHSAPTLTSIARNSERVGYEAAACLNRMMNGESGPAREILIPPNDVIVRESSDMMYCSDPLVRQAIAYMRKHLRANLNIENIADGVGVSKRKLERSFAGAVNCPPRQYLIKLRILHAQALIRMNPGKTIEATAVESGFPTTPAFYVAFQRLTGCSPSEFRSRTQRQRKQ